MFAMLSIAVGLLVLLGALELYGLCRRRAQADEPHNDLRRAGQHPAPAAYEPGAAYAKTAGAGGGAL
jgi:hypothetical protein